jgi:hypothetical protein
MPIDSPTPTRQQEDDMTTTMSEAARWRAIRKAYSADEKRLLDAEIKLSLGRVTAWDRRWWMWMDLHHEDGAELAWFPEFVELFNSTTLHCYDPEDITDLGPIRDHDGRHYQRCRIYCTDADKYEWRWVTCCCDCGSARCHTAKTTN